MPYLNHWHLFIRKFIFLLVLLINQNGYCSIFKVDTSQVDTSFRAIELQLTVKGSEIISEHEAATEVFVQLKTKDGDHVPGVTIYIQGAKNDSIYRKSKTDSFGVSVFAIDNIKKGGPYNLTVFIRDNVYYADPVIFTYKVWAKNWIFIMIIGLAGGLSLFLLGMSQMSSGMQNAAGNKMRDILNKISNNRFVAVGIGAIITSIIQSSSATNVMLVSFVDSHLMKFRQTIAIILGAAIGTTITAQIIAFKITDYALIFVSIGLFAQLISKRNKVKETGRAVLGFGILFFGMHIMSESMIPLRSYQPFIDLLLRFENPVLGILAGAIFTALIQSSSAFIGILIILSMQSLISFEASASMIVGANIGTAITAILASINTNREAKQVALAHTLIKLLGAIFFIGLFLIFRSFIENRFSLFGELATSRQIANVHTIYNIILCILFIPFTNQVAWLVNRIFPLKESDSFLKLQFIDHNLIHAPSFAIEAARKEIQRMTKIVQYMVEKIIDPFMTRDTAVLKAIEKSEQEINFLRDNLNDFLVRLSQSPVGEDEVEEAFILMNVVGEYEQIADIVSQQLKLKAESWCANKYQFSKSGQEELLRYHQMTLKIIKKARKAYNDFDIAKARKLKQKYYNFRKEYFELERLHYERLVENIEETVSSSKTHLEIITLLRIISSHATNTARIVIRKGKIN